MPRASLRLTSGAGKRKDAPAQNEACPIMDAAKGAGESNAIDELDVRRRRLRYRAWHRGTRELELVLGPYADAHAGGLDVAGLARLEALMEEADTDLLKWVIGQESPPAGVDEELIARLIAFRHTMAAAR
jgi:antitoxin CptB